MSTPDNFKTQKLCEKSVEEDPWRLYAVPDRSKIKRCATRPLRQAHIS